MKKFVCLMVALLLCLSACALAESVPSKTTEDMIKIEVSGENLPADATFFVKPVDESDPVYQERVEVSDAEIAKLVAAAEKVAYFGNVKDSEGNPVSLTEMLGVETINVYEFCPLIAGNYEEAYGKVTAVMLFATPYEKDELVAVLIGLVTAENGEQVVEWTAYEGIGQEDGSIRVELDPDMVKKVQDGVALLAIASK